MVPLRSLIAIRITSFNDGVLVARIIMNSGGAEIIDKMLCCASCGIAGGGDVKLKDCSACKLVKYCGIECQRRHRKKHKKECKKRAAELRDELLFKQPEGSYRGDCPICCVPMPTDPQKHLFMVCCSKTICLGCDYANLMREFELRLQPKCPFCRHPLATSDEEAERNLMKRVEANDPAAIGQMGFYRYNAGNHSGAVECYTNAAEFGSVEAHYNLSIMYVRGEGVEKDEKKELYHLEEAAIGGHPDARNKLAALEWRRKKSDRAIKHFVIAANQGHDEALEALKIAYRDGLVSKDDLASALRAHQAAVDAARSPQREEAEEIRKREGY